jgi:hypothetical protein
MLGAAASVPRPQSAPTPIATHEARRGWVGPSREIEKQRRPAVIGAGCADSSCAMSSRRCVPTLGPPLALNDSYSPRRAGRRKTPRFWRHEGPRMAPRSGGIVFVTSAAMTEAQNPQRATTAAAESVQHFPGARLDANWLEQLRTQRHVPRRSHPRRVPVELAPHRYERVRRAVATTASGGNAAICLAPERPQASPPRGSARARRDSSSLLVAQLR